MILRPLEAIRTALDEIQDLGYVIVPGNDGENVEIIWPRADVPPDIETCLQIIETDPDTVGKVLQHDRSVTIPLWLILGYPWDRPVKFWKQMQESYYQNHALASKKKDYASACIKFYENKKSCLWKNIFWKEPWPILL